MRKEYHYWLTAFGDDGKPYLVYACPARDGEEQARQKGIEMLPNIDFQIKKLPTRDLGAASSMIRGKRLETTHSLKEASQRQGHTKTILRDRKRKMRKGSKATNPLW